jgi:hypothetical protein
VLSFFSSVARTALSAQCRCLGITVSLTLAIAANAAAQAIWTGTPGATGDWFDQNNWLDGSVPTSGSVIIDNGGTAQRATSLSTSISSLSLGGAPLGAGTLLLSAGTLNTASLFLGDAGVGRIDQANSALSSTGTVNIGSTGAGGTGQYNLASGTFTASRLLIGSAIAPATGTFSQSGGISTVTTLSINAGGQYTLSEGTLQINTTFANLGTINFLGGAGTLIANGFADFSRGALLNTSGAHLIGSANALVILPSGTGAGSFASFTNAGKTLISGDTLTISNGESRAWSGDLYENVDVQGALSSVASGSLSLLKGLNISGTGTVSVFSVGITNLTSGIADGTLSTPTFNVGSSAGAAFTQTAGRVQPVGSGRLTMNVGTASSEVGTYSFSGGELSVATASIGGAGIGHFDQSGGSSTFGTLSVSSGSTLRYSGGTLAVVSLTSHGTLDLGSSTVTLAPAGIANFASTSFQGTSDATLLGESNSLMVFSPGVDPALVFGSFSTGGILHTAGTDLVINSAQTIEGAGVIDDRVVVYGAISGPSTVGGLNIHAGGSASLFSATITDLTSGIDGGDAALTQLHIQRDGVFTQSGGSISLNSLQVASDEGSGGTYIQTGGNLEFPSRYIVGRSGAGTFLQTGGTASFSSRIGWPVLGAVAGSAGYQEVNGGTFSSTSNRFVVGDLGAGTFVQSGGVATVANPRIGLSTGSSGYFRLSDGVLSSPGIVAVGNSGSGTLVQNGGTFDAVSMIIKSVSTGEGYFLKTAGQLTIPSVTNNGTFIHSGGTLSISGFSNTGVATLGGTQIWASGSTFTNTGQATFTSNAGEAGRNLLIAASSGTVVFESSQSLRSITFSGGKVRIAAGTGAVIGVRSLSSGVNMDLGDGALVYDYDGTSPEMLVRDWLVGSQLYSSSSDAQHRIGYAEAAELYPSLPTTFAGEPLDATTILIRFTLAGDANLDGTVDAVDLGNLALHWNSVATHWFDGDFTYDGRIDVADLKLLAINFTSPADGPSLETLLVSFGLPVDAMPEPAMALPLACGYVLLRRSRRRRPGGVGESNS